MSLNKRLGGINNMVLCMYTLSNGINNKWRRYKVGGMDKRPSKQSNVGHYYIRGTSAGLTIYTIFNHQLIIEYFLECILP